MKSGGLCLRHLHDHDERRVRTRRSSKQRIRSRQGHQERESGHDKVIKTENPVTTRASKRRKLECMDASACKAKREEKVWAQFVSLNTHSKISEPDVGWVIVANKRQSRHRYMKIVSWITLCLAAHGSTSMLQEKKSDKIVTWKSFNESYSVWQPLTWYLSCCMDDRWEWRRSQ